MHRSHIVYSLALLSLLGVALLAGSWSDRSAIAPAEAAHGGDHFDVRDLIGPDDEEEPTADQIEALDALKIRTGADVRADFNRLNGTPTSVFARGSFLSVPKTGSPEQIADDFLVDNSGLFAVTPDFVAGLEELRSYVNERTGLAHIQYRQEHGGMPVFQSTLRVAVTEDGRVLSVIGDYHPDLPALGSDPALSEAQALDAAFSYVGLPVALEPADTATITLGLSDAFAPATELVVFPLAGGDATLAWRVLVPQVIDYWDVVVDAGDGALLYSSNLTADTGPEGQVFAEHPDASALTTVPFVGSLPAPRDSWIGPTSLSACVICTNGNNVAAISDRLGDFSGPFASDPDTHFNFGFADSWALTGDPDPDEGASVTNLFYLVNVAHDYFYDLGFTEAAGNFQDDNFGAGGLGGDPVVATTYTHFDFCPHLPQFNCLNNAFFSTPPEGSVPILSSFLFTSPNRDPSFDGDVMFHEYAHGVSSRIVGVGALTGIQSGAMGEGWSDYFAISFYDDPVMGEYSTQNAATGIRNFAYDVSPLTYGNLCLAGCQVHNDGEIWAATLWDLRQFYVGDLGLASGRVAADELIVEGLMLTPPLPSMLDARDAILQAELASGGTNQADLWQVFAGRGMGCSAFSIGDTGTISEAFDIPVGGSCDGAACDSPVSPLAIPNSNPTGVSDTIVLADSGVIADLRVCLRIDHARVGDLSASLTHVETGTTVALVDRPGVPGSPFGCSGDDIIAILDDAAATAVED
ncbi:MAG: M36 family metallopeptidase, partial [Chloroflexi bacterium]|nr:M36 family metallopeptidase [Chloroflexota bacterium]